MTSTIAIVQARLGSTRLTGKTLMDIMGKPMLWHVIDRLKRAKCVDDIVIATTTKERDEAIVKLVRESHIKSYAGSEEDVLDRYYQAATIFKGDIIVRVTSDCPLIDPEVVNRVIKRFLAGGFDYVSNTLPPTYPDGLDTEVFSYTALKKAWEKARLKSEREHVTPYIWKHPDMFRIGNVKYKEDLSDLRWTVDESQDMEFVRAVFRHLGTSFGMAQVLRLLSEYPELANLNTGVKRNEGYLKSLREDDFIKEKR